MYMNRLRICLLGMLGMHSCSVAGGVPRFEVDLDEDPRKRWRHVSEYWKDYSLAMAKPMENNIVEALGDSFDEWAEVANNAFDEESSEEIEGMLEAVDPTPDTLQERVTMSKLSNLLYELSSPTASACAGVLWAMENGTVIHGRNMDYTFLFNMTDKATGETKTLNWDAVTFEVLFKKGGKPLYLSTMWPGGVGIHTAMRLNGWSFEQNTRASFMNRGKNLEAAKQGGVPFGLAARRVMESTADFEEAVEQLYNSKFMAPMYFIVAGKGWYEGAILTLDRLGKHNKNTPPILRVSNSPDGWHVVQTNDDQDKYPLDIRRPVAKLQMGQLERGQVSAANMASYTSLPPLNNNGTVFTTVMVPATGHFQTILREHTSLTKYELGEGIKKDANTQRAYPSKPHRKRQLRGLHKLSKAEPDDDDSAFLQVALERPEL